MDGCEAAHALGGADRRGLLIHTMHVSSRLQTQVAKCGVSESPFAPRMEHGCNVFLRSEWRLSLAARGIAGDST